MTNFPLLSELGYWINERWAILERRKHGEKKPWTEDPIFQSYRFCNVRREDDTVTQWIRKNWREPYDGHENMAFAMLMARLVNWPPTLNYLGFPLGWDAKSWIDKMHRCFELNDKVFSGAYIVSTNGIAMDKSEYLAERVLGPCYDRFKTIPRNSLEKAAFHICQMNGVGSFIGGQVIADLKYTSVLKDASDWMNWCAPGPGSRRGLNRVGGWPLSGKWHDTTQFIRVVRELRSQLNTECLMPDIPDLCLQDLQNCLCEFDKYQRTKLGEGRPRSTYPGL